jgi:hypothetical protein
MKILLWAVCAVLALLWTGTAALAAQLIAWSAEALAAGRGAEIGSAVATMTAPSWLTPWLDIAGWSALQQAVAGVLSAVSGSLPLVGELASWLVPVVWVVWGLGLVALLGLAFAGSWLLRRAKIAPRALPAI